MTVVIDLPFKAEQPSQALAFSRYGGTEVFVEENHVLHSQQCAYVELCSCKPLTDLRCLI